MSQSDHRQLIPTGLVRRFVLAAGVALPLALTAACNSAAPGATSDAAASVAAQQQAQKAEAERVAGAIEAALHADAQTGSISDDTQRAQAMRAIDTSACPPDFRAAYLDHIFAWERYAKVTKAISDLNSDDSVNVTLALSALTALLGGSGTPILDHIQAAERLDELKAEANGQIRATFERVQVVATGYGATLPNS